MNIIYCLLVLCIVQYVSCVYVTKDMGTGRSIDLTDIARPGLEYVEKYGVRDPSTLPSVVMVPGLGGSQLYATLNKTDGPWYCFKEDAGYVIWLELTELFPGEETCWQQNMELSFDGVAVHNASGVQIEPISFGSTTSFEYLDPDFKSESIYFAGSVESLLAIGYQRDVSLFGAPYDWRLSPNFDEAFTDNLQSLIEKAYAVNNKPVVVFCHSMGNMRFQYLMTKMTQEWKDKYIQGMAAVAPPWIGASDTLSSILTGSNLGIPWLSPITARSLDRSYPSSYFLLPYGGYYGDEVFVSTPTGNYTAQNYTSLFNDLGDNNATLVYDVSYGIYDPSVPLGVNVIVYHGQNVSTPHAFVYTTNDWDETPTVINGDGDGTVPLESLTYGSIWPSNYTVKAYEGQTHQSILSDSSFLNDFIADFIKN